MQNLAFNYLKLLCKNGRMRAFVTGKIMPKFAKIFILKNREILI